MNKIKPNHPGRRKQAVVSLLLFGFVVVPTVLELGKGSRAQITQTAQTNNGAQAKDGGASEATLVREYLDGMQKLRAADLTPEARAQLDQQLAQKRAQLRDLRKQTRLARGILPFGPPPRQSGSNKKSTAAVTSDAKQTSPSAQKCVSCQYIWNQIALDIGDSKYVAEVQAAFQKNCMDSQKATVFYGVCEDMYDDIYAMTDDYMTGTFDAPAICARAGACPASQ